MQALGLQQAEAKAMLDRAYPNGWEHAPYLVTVSQDRIQAWKGWRLALQLAWLLGPRKAWKVWTLVSGSRPAVASNSSNASSRRWFLKGGILALAAALATQFVHPSSVAFACAPCDTCGEHCQLVQYCVYFQACGSFPLDPCDKYNCYDNRTGELCYSYWDCCCDCGSCA